MTGTAALPRRAARRRLIRLGLVLGWICPAIGFAAAPTPEPPSQSAAVAGADSDTGAAGAETPGRDWDRRLTGIIISPELRAAVFVLESETRTVAEGQQIDGWVVTAVRRDSVSIETAGETRLLVPEASAPGKAQDTRSPDATQQLQKARSASESLLKQKRDQAAAELALVEATAKMTGH